MDRLRDSPPVPGSLALPQGMDTKVQAALGAAKTLQHWAQETQRRNETGDASSVKASCGAGERSGSGSFGPKSLSSKVMDFLQVESVLASFGDEAARLRSLLVRKYGRREELEEKDDIRTTAFFVTLKSSLAAS